MKVLPAPALATALIFVFGGPVLAHHCGHHDGHCRHHETCDCPNHHQGSRAVEASRMMQEFTSVSGVVSEVIYLPGASPDQASVELRLGTGVNSKLVRLAPAGFLNKNKLSPKEGDRVMIRGFRVATPDGDVLVAVNLRRGESSLRLRDTRGRPLW